MIREIIVTSPTGVRLAFEASGEKGLHVEGEALAGTIMVFDLDRDRRCTGLVPTSWLIELNENVT